MTALRAAGQQVLGVDDAAAPSDLPRVSDLRPASNLVGLFADIHNYIYANEGLLKEKIFHEVVELLLLKLDDESRDGDEPVRFGVTADELRDARAGSAPTFADRMAALTDDVAQRHPMLLPDNRRVGLRLSTLAEVVAMLQPYNLTRTPGDVKGFAFQSFVAANQRGDRGEYFTPDPIVRLAVGSLEPRPGERVIDPACGSAGFLVETKRFVVRHHGLDPSDAERYMCECIRGIEFNPDVARAAAIRLAFEGGTSDGITCADALRDGLDSEATYDVVLTNPPFGSKGKITDVATLERYDLGHRWRNVNDRWSKTDDIHPQAPEVLFLELCVRLLAPGGRLAIVLPEGFLQNPSTRYIREWLHERVTTRGVFSVTQTAFVPFGTGIKTSVLILENRPPRSEDVVFMARLDKIGYDSKGQPTFANDGTDGGGQRLDDDSDPMAAEFRSWSSGGNTPARPKSFVLVRRDLADRLDVDHYLPEDRALLSQLRETNARPLGELAKIVSKSDPFRRTDEEIRYIALSDVDPRTLQVVTHQILHAADAPSRASYRLHAGDIITATAGASTGTRRHATAIITADEEGAICSNGFAVLRDVVDVDPLFLAAFMRTSTYLRQVRRLLTGHAIPAVSNDDLRRVLVPIPPGEVQTQVARKVTELLELRREALARAASVAEAAAVAIEDATAH